jgi:hypothetical protein
VTFIPIEAVGAGLVAVTGLGIHGRDHSVFRHLPGDTQPAVLAHFEVLTSDGGEQLASFSYRPIEAPPPK